MKHKFYKTIKGRFLIITTVLILIVGAGASTMAYALFSQNLRDNQLHAAETNLQFLKNSIDADMIDVMNLSRTSRTSSNILNFVNTSRDHQQQYPEFCQHFQGQRRLQHHYKKCH